MPTEPDFGDVRPVFRFAPSPNGRLHLGHALSALLNADLAHASGGRLLLRLEDIDTARCTPALVEAILEDLVWLGIRFETPVRLQSRHMADYETALDALRADGLVYAAFGTRGETRRHASLFEEREGRPWPRDPDGALLYPALDRELDPAERDRRIAAGEPHAWRLDMSAALGRVAGSLLFEERGEGTAVLVPAEPELWGDVVLARADTPASYHLAVSVDDALQGVTDVVRGADLLPSTSVHRLLQALLGLPVPRYHHHRLVLGDDGLKLSKSRGDTALAELRAAGLSPADICRMVGLSGHREQP
ncbi:tRNA glutamyl-Q(34) synthetase GluQRS [Aureimonas jatrophae]|uniref:Glutamyl-Q tRNA(Asp) synthetase n=1 Tax=Aureimonas jatrophae TaxID=1166073 RepID=A0A1H0ID85_9HYPH|nr:tRNA glutamyl-Q(34) synthetase GluQRS [Aureimonas jatrophae]MBB3952106.1 glutamyl-Q tRNA(Asp) synthetase [Aureimonas jatrophae]SDO29429.1 glutamyl-Q tRNA(Asp) synthetase [Aureimonas jatrophae]